MIKRIIFFLLITALLTNICSCALLKEPIDKRTGFSDHLKQTEDYVRNQEWKNAKASLEDSIKVWKKLKPILQVDIDHDYIDRIEDDFIKLSGYIDTNDKSDSLATILLIQDTWDNIGSL